MASKLQFNKIQKTTIAETIISQIEQMIADGDIKPGEMLPSERVLSEQLGVSRPPVREALARLDALGIVEIRVGEGTFLRNNIDLISRQLEHQNRIFQYKARDLADARMVLEMAILERVIPVIDETGIERLAACIDKGREARDTHNVEAFVISDYEFHLTLAEISGNEVLKELFETLRRLYYELNRWRHEQSDIIKRNHETHEKLLEAIKSKDLKIAQKLMRQHLNVLVSVLDDEESQEVAI